MQVGKKDFARICDAWNDSILNSNVRLEGKHLNSKLCFSIGLLPLQHAFPRLIVQSTYEYRQHIFSSQ